jgi:hypothetical protein
VQGEYDYLQSPTLPNQILEDSDRLDDAIEKGSFTLQAAGFPQTGVDTATGIIMLSEAAGQRFALPVAQLDHLFSVGLSKVLWMHDRMHDVMGKEFDVTVKIGEDALRVEDIEHQYHITVSFGRKDAVADMQQAKDDREEMMMQPIPLMSRKRYWERRGVEDTSGEEKEIWQDLADRMPEVMMANQEIALRETDRLKLADELEMKRKREKMLADMVGPDGQTPLFKPDGQPAQPSSNGRPNNA